MCLWKSELPHGAIGITGSRRIWAKIYSDWSFKKNIRKRKLKSAEGFAIFLCCLSLPFWNEGLAIRYCFQSFKYKYENSLNKTFCAFCKFQKNLSLTCYWGICLLILALQLSIRTNSPKSSARCPTTEQYLVSNRQMITHSGWFTRLVYFDIFFFRIFRHVTVTLVRERKSEHPHLPHRLKWYRIHVDDFQSLSVLHSFPSRGSTMPHHST